MRARLNRRVARHHDERGSTLMLALLFVTSIAFLMGVTLDAAFSAVNTGKDTRVQRTGRYAAEGAIDVLASAMRNDRNNPNPTDDGDYGRYGAQCPPTKLVVSSVTYVATCTPEVTSGVLSDDGSSRSDRVVDVAVTNLADGTEYVRARVTVKDGGGFTYGQWVTIREWSLNQ